MKRCFKYLVIVCMLVLLAGCGKGGEKDMIKNLTKKIEKLDSYNLNGELQIVNNEDNYEYDVEVSYQKNNNFRVSLKNKMNNHEQIILRNEDGVYVLTPSLNKSFKFQSEWPYNNSQIYLLQSLINDIKNDDNKVIEKNNDGYVITVKVNYVNNGNLVKEQIYVDNDLNIKEVLIMDTNEVVQMKMVFNRIDYKASYDKDYFDLKNNTSEISETTSKTLDGIIYPMYIPENTMLSSQDRVSTETGERIILTFSGERPFTLIQEPVTVTEELLTIPVYGDPYTVTGTIGVVDDTSITWLNNGVEFYVVSETLTKQELLDVANSISVSTIFK